LENSLLDLLPGGGERVDEIEVVGSGNLQQMNVLFVFVLALAGFFLGRKVVAAESGWDYIVSRSVDEALVGLRDGELHGIGLAVVFGGVEGSAT